MYESNVASNNVNKNISSVEFLLNAIKEKRPTMYVHHPSVAIIIIANNVTYESAMHIIPP